MVSLLPKLTRPLLFLLFLLLTSGLARTEVLAGCWRFEEERLGERLFWGGFDFTFEKANLRERPSSEALVSELSAGAGIAVIRLLPPGLRAKQQTKRGAKQSE